MLVVTFLQAWGCTNCWSSYILERLRDARSIATHFFYHLVICYFFFFVAPHQTCLLLSWESIPKNYSSEQVSGELPFKCKKAQGQHISGIWDGSARGSPIWDGSAMMQSGWVRALGFRCQLGRSPQPAAPLLLCGPSWKAASIPQAPLAQLTNGKHHLQLRSDVKDSFFSWACPGRTSILIRARNNRFHLLIPKLCFAKELQVLGFGDSLRLLSLSLLLKPTNWNRHLHWLCFLQSLEILSTSFLRKLFLFRYAQRKNRASAFNSLPKCLKPHFHS